MSFDVEHLQRQIPSYLTSQDQKKLIAELKAISAGNNSDFYLRDRDNSFKDQMLQGDGWQGFELFSFETGKRHSVRGVIFSNTCDVDPANKRELPTRIVFSPLVKLSAFKRILEKSTIDKDVVQAKICSIKAQKTSNIFFLPANDVLREDYLLRLDDVHSMPIAAHSQKSKLFTLSMVGFYMFVLKLSVHFCRLQENVRRNT